MLLSMYTVITRSNSRSLGERDSVISWEESAILPRSHDPIFYAINM